MCRNNNHIESISKIVICLKKGWKYSQQMILTVHYLCCVVQCLNKSAADREFAALTRAAAQAAAAIAILRSVFRAYRIMRYFSTR